MRHLLYLMFRCDGDVMENLNFGGIFGASKHTTYLSLPPSLLPSFSCGDEAPPFTGDEHPPGLPAPSIPFLLCETELSKNYFASLPLVQPVLFSGARAVWIWGFHQRKKILHFLKGQKMAAAPKILHFARTSIWWMHYLLARSHK